jgi:hypothetical protein
MREDTSVLVNYRVDPPYYVVESFEGAKLIVGVGGQQDRVTILRQAEDR